MQFTPALYQHVTILASRVSHPARVGRCRWRIRSGAGAAAESPGRYGIQSDESRRDDGTSTTSPSPPDHDPHHRHTAACDAAEADTATRTRPRHIRHGDAPQTDAPLWGSHETPPMSPPDGHPTGQRSAPTRYTTTRRARKDQPAAHTPHTPRPPHRTRSPHRDPPAPTPTNQTPPHRRSCGRGSPSPSPPTHRPNAGPANKTHRPATAAIRRHANTTPAPRPDRQRPGVDPTGATTTHRASAESTHTDPSTPAARHNVTSACGRRPAGQPPQDPDPNTSQRSNDPHPHQPDAASPAPDRTSPVHRPTTPESTDSSPAAAQQTPMSRRPTRYVKPSRHILRRRPAPRTRCHIHLVQLVGDHRLPIPHHSDLRLMRTKIGIHLIQRPCGPQHADNAPNGHDTERVPAPESREKSETGRYCLTTWGVALPSRCKVHLKPQPMLRGA